VARITGFGSSPTNEYWIWFEVAPLGETKNGLARPMVKVEVGPPSVVRAARKP
jgi:hypothetical protein